MLKLLPPTSYQGGKARLASQIVEILLKEGKPNYYDLCCGSGTISLELVNQGVPVERITMVDAGPWGLFWKEIGKGTFSISKLKDYLEALPKNPENIKEAIESLSKTSADQDTVYVFLLLQAASFGSKPIWYEAGKWQNCSFRSYWKPTSSSNRKSPVNPMMPMPATILERVSLLVEKMKGVVGIHGKIENLLISPASAIYIDPPYQNTTPYGFQLNILDLDFIKNLKRKCFVSEGKKLTETAILLANSQSRTKGGISGKKKISPNQEWLNIFQGS